MREQRKTKEEDAVKDQPPCSHEQKAHEQDKISVIVPVYKVEDYLDICITSIIRQTYTNLEILLIDDGSPDQCGKMCDAWAEKDTRIKVIHKKNGGLSSARNSGIDASTGAYILFVDSDDWVDPPMAEILHRLCVQYKAQIAECSYRNIYRDKVQEESACGAQIVEATPVQAIEGNLDWHFFKPVAWNKLYNRQVIGDIRYPVGKLHEDEFTTHKYYLAADKIVFTDISLYNYNHKRDNSITASFRPANMDSCEAFREKMHLVWERPDLKSIERKMNNSYCYVLFERLAQSEKAKYTGLEVSDAVRSALKDYSQMHRHGIDDTYVQCFGLLQDQGVHAAAKQWMKIRGIE